MWWRRPRGPEGDVIPKQELWRPFREAGWDYEPKDSPSVLTARLEFVRRDRDALRNQIVELMDQRDILVKLWQITVEERDAARARN